MRAGGLRHKVTIQTFTTIRLPSGQVLQQWEDAATVWAEVKAISGRELIASGAEMSEITIRVWMRYRADVNSANRIRFTVRGGKPMNYDITAVIPDEKATRLELLCKGGVSQ
ncbi:phage head closure protein [Yersinia pseudotuberculosis]|uniref:phage head closure protein n=1 Tax=Yersinia pseudotuberculosis TaxID=633 RepID=UPI001A9E3BED|nr:phage head closure protein [Yersinia pseudotuberculosis]MBO1551528.1 phage head closure protein [Yersinia pseudotuberculosis]MBO1571578.1 phage head closure protein [Yersinia pseudotuberculosis]MBO1586526.1 phage head closure protein [Yersinia pseudotuberculosis]MBO1636029.1 phage head closure protein [Yersinia pseudotuberculosis]